MKTIATSFHSHTRWIMFPLLVFLISCLILPNLASAQYIYNIETTTGKNGADKAISIVLVGTLAGMDDAFELDAPGDDFKPNAVNKFVYRSDKDLGDITDMALKANSEDYWEVKKVVVKKTGSNYTSTWTAFRGGLIKGEWTKFFRADGLQNISVNCCTNKPIQTSIQIETLDNLDNPNPDDIKTRPVPVETTVSNDIELVNTNTNSVTNSLDISTSVSYEPFPGGPSFTSEVAYGLQVFNETTKALTQSSSSTVKTNDKLTDLVAPPGTIQYAVIKTSEIRKQGKITLLTGETEFYKVIGNEYDIKYYTYNRDNIDDIPEFIIQAKGKPRCISCTTAKTTITPNPTPVTSPPPPSPSVEKQVTSEVEVCDNAGNVIGFFKQNGSTWAETDAYGNTRFQFQETRRDQGVVYLSDTGRPGVKINLDLNNRAVLYSDNNNTTPFRIYVISKTN